MNPIPPRSIPGALTTELYGQEYMAYLGGFDPSTSLRTSEVRCRDYTTQQKLLQSMNKVRNRTKDSKIERYLPRVDESTSSVWCEWWWWGYEEGDVALKCLINQFQPSLYNKLRHRKSTKSNITKIIIQNHNTQLQ